MQLEWNRFWEEITAFKEGQGMLWLFCLAVFVYCFKKEIAKKHRIFVTSFVLGAMVLFPLTAVVLLKVYTPFYNWNDLQQMFPMVMLIAFGGVELFSFLRKQDIPGLCLSQTGKNIISAACVVILLFTATNFHGFDQRQNGDERGIPVETSDVFASLWQLLGDKPIVLAAPGEMLQYARLYEPAWQPVYGRDLWSGKSASYINTGYDREYAYYTLLEDARLPEEECTELISLINEGQADCIIVPDFWLEIMSGMTEYDSVRLTASYVGIIKKDLLSE